MKGVLLQSALQDGSLKAAQYLLDRMNAWPQPENAAAAQQLQIVVRGGIAAVQPKIDGQAVADAPESGDATDAPEAGDAPVG